MKSILISIKPEWVCKILNGEKTIEVRKTAPKCELPIDVYIYCTKGQEELYEAFKPLGRKAPYQTKPKNQHLTGGILKEGFHLNGKVVAKFTLSKVDWFCTRDFWGEYKEGVISVSDSTDPATVRKSCVPQQEIDEYTKGKPAYAWHISNLEIFDEPKELEEFGLKKAPQSWCHVEEKE